ncbi:hypothetical protein [Sphingobacterium sp. UME9]|uniref:hypothetical protein n=1 Tax=Sphingobacterium sp. UME9 TaxID=1862316 RepID=UPI001603A1B6|nr:hypothetical protein [Sphingobacterium sp. UME9]MBB1647679.1 hypothetical protein [Sphingobacterium sp. UME9]
MKSPSLCLIAVNGQFADFSLKERVQIAAWNQKKQELSGTDDDHRIKEKIRVTEKDINTTYGDLKLAKCSLSPETVKAKYLGEEDNKQVTLLWHKIVVMNKGQIVEIGTHKELISKQGYYFSLVKDQIELDC